MTQETAKTTLDLEAELVTTLEEIARVTGRTTQQVIREGLGVYDTAAAAAVEPIPDSLSVRWSPRGVGYGGGYADLVTGEPNEGGPDLSGFVRSKAEGHLACAIFGGNAFLDWRAFEPRWIQVKVTCADRGVLLRLCQLVDANNSILTPAIVRQALSPAKPEAES